MRPPMRLAAPLLPHYRAGPTLLAFFSAYSPAHATATAPLMPIAAGSRQDAGDEIMRDAGGAAALPDGSLGTLPA